MDQQEDSGAERKVNGAADSHGPEPGGEIAIALAAKTLSGDMRDDTLEIVRRLKTTWAPLDEDRQQLLANNIESACQKVIARAVRIIGARNFPALTSRIKDLKRTDKGIEVKLLIDGFHKERHGLLDAVDGMLVLASEAAFFGARGPAAIDKQQRTLGLAGDAGEPEAAADGPLPDEDEQDGSGELPAPPEAIEPAAGTAERKPYDLGYEAFRAGESRDFCPFVEGEGEGDDYALWCAGHWQAACEAFMHDTSAQQNTLADADAFFRDMGRVAAEAGDGPDANPFETWMLARKWWAEGFFDETGREDEAGDVETGAETQEPPARRRGRSRKGDGPEAAAP